MKRTPFFSRRNGTLIGFLFGLPVLALLGPAAPASALQRERIRTVVSVGLVTMPALEDVAGDWAPVVDVDKSNIGYQVTVEVHLTGSLYVKTTGQRWTADVTQGLGSTATNRTDLTVLGLSGAVGLRTPLARSLFGSFYSGPVWLRNSGEITTTIDGLTQAETRTESGFRWTLGASLDFDLTPSVGLRFDASYIRGGSDDADEATFISGGVVIS